MKKVDDVLLKLVLHSFIFTNGLTVTDKKGVSQTCETLNISKAKLFKLIDAGMKKGFIVHADYNRFILTDEGWNHVDMGTTIEEHAKGQAKSFANFVKLNGSFDWRSKTHKRALCSWFPGYSEDKLYIMFEDAGFDGLIKMDAKGNYVAVEEEVN